MLLAGCLHAQIPTLDIPEVILEDGGPGDSFELLVGGISYTVDFVPSGATSQDHVMTNTAIALKDALAADTNITSKALVHQNQNIVALEPKDGESPVLLEIHPVDDGSAPAATAHVYNPGNNSTVSPNPLSPVVSNVTAGQVAGTKLMEIFFDLAVEDNHTCNITVKWSTDNGATYPLTATAVAGRAGPGIAPGNGHKITWDMEIDWNHQFTQTGRIKVIASRDPIDAPTGTGTNSPTDDNTPR